MTNYFYWQNEQLYLNILVQPKASCNEVVGVHGDALKVRITAPPVEGKANQHLQKWLAHHFGVTLQQVRIVSGQQGRRKKVCIDRPTRNLPAQTDFN